jgi:hypothetical protein
VEAHGRSGVEADHAELRQASRALGALEQERALAPLGHPAEDAERVVAQLEGFLQHRPPSVAIG